MQYITEINAFDRRMARAPLSSNAQLLWYKLMQIANRAMWPTEFQVDNDRLLKLLNVKSLHTLTSARKELQDDGLIVFTPGKKGMPSTYRMISVDELEGPDLSCLESTARADDFLCAVREDITTYFGYTEAVGRELDELTALIWGEFFPGKTPTLNDKRQVFYLTKQQEQREDGSWELTLPEERKEMLAYAFDQARMQDKLFWKYILSIFANWRQRGTMTMEDIDEAEYQREMRKGRL